MASLSQDVRYAFRVFVKSPVFTGVAVLTLALGIGANTAIFSVANALLLRPLPYPEAHRLVLLTTEKKASGSRSGPLTFPRFTFIREQNRSFSNAAAFTNEQFNLSGRGDPEEIPSARVSYGFFETLGVPPALGRTFRPEEDQPGGDSVVLISYNLWTRLFGRDPSAVGQHLSLDARDYTIIGVLPDDFRFGFLGANVEIIAPRVFELNIVTPQQVRAGVGFLCIVARLKPEVSISQAQAELDALSASYRVQNPTLPDADPGTSVVAGNLRDELVYNVRPAILTLFGAVSLVLLIACANVASLLLSRALGRRREIAVRTAMGASRRELIRQLLTESVMLALLGGAIGIALSSWGTPVLAAMARDTLPRAAEIHTSALALIFTVAVSMAAGILFGLAPALQISRPDLNTDLRSEGRGSTAGKKRGALRNLLVVFQMALSLLLLIGAGLLIRNFVQLRAAAPGFDPNRLLTMRISLPPARYSGAAKMIAFYDQLLTSVRTLPGVIAAAESSALPVNPARFSPALPEGQSPVPLMQRPMFNIQTISPGYTSTMRLPLLQGREFTAGDDTQAPRVVMVNETVARRFWPHDNPVGKHILVGRATAPSEVVGVLGDLRNLGIAADVQPEIYLPFAQLAWPSMHLVVRTAGDPRAFIGTVRACVLALDRDQPVTSIQTMDEVLETAAAQPRFTAALLGVLSVTALVLAIVGIYGVISYSVSERTQEMGIRLALGAERADILRLVMRQALTLALSGVGIGLAASLALTRLLGSMLYRVSATDPLTFVGGSVLFVLAALAASYFPALRATRVDPLVALRYE
ncbi:MAG TPA: ABC transporter permease [Bryobacteraceae bacterium]|nr:ABC transporter permease [Bryobacteraceae bacterium]